MNSDYSPVPLRSAWPVLLGIRNAWLAPVTARPLAWFRMGLAAGLLAQALSLLGHLHDLYGRYGLVDWSVMWESQWAGVPNLAWLDGPLEKIDVPTSFAVPLTFALYVVGLLGLVVGYRTRLAAGVAWLTHTALVGSSFMTSYGVDQFAHIGLFYCLWFPAGQALSLDHSLGMQRGKALAPTFAAWLSLRLLQLHVGVIYTASGIEKALGHQWWNGEALWRAVIGAPLGTPFDCSFLAGFPWLSQGLCWATLLLEAGVFVWVWHPWLRKIWLGSTVSLHLGIAFVLGLGSFSAVMIVFDVAAFGIPARPSTPGRQRGPTPDRWARVALALPPRRASLRAQTNSRTSVVNQP